VRNGILSTTITSYFLPGRPKHAIAAIVGDYGNVAFLSQALGPILGRLEIVLDNENLH
jgi:hypothetical protein